MTEGVLPTNEYGDEVEWLTVNSTRHLVEGTLTSLSRDGYTIWKILVLPSPRDLQLHILQVVAYRYDKKG